MAYGPESPGQPSIAEGGAGVSPYRYEFLESYPCVTPARPALGFGCAKGRDTRRVEISPG